MDVGETRSRGPSEVEEVEVRVLRRVLRPEQSPEESRREETRQK